MSGLVKEPVDELSLKRNAKFIRHVRKNILKITQAEAVRLLSGGGHNAFSRYELGTVAAPKALMVLMKLLEKKPELLNDIKSWGNDHD